MKAYPRSKLDNRSAPFVQPAEKEKLPAALQEAEDWLYTEEGEDASKSAYVSRLEALHASLVTSSSSLAWGSFRMYRAS